MSCVNLGNLLLKEAELAQACRYFEHALKTDPDYQPAHAGLSFALGQLGEEEPASRHRRAAFQDRCVIPIPYRGEQKPIPVLELIATDGGNTRIQKFLSNSIFQRYLVTTEFCNAATILPPHLLVVNAIGDSDTASIALAGAQALVSRLATPVINPPSAVMKTGRCTLSKVLSGIAGVITPRTVSFSRQALSAPCAAETLREQGFTFPLLMRTPGYHGGENFLFVENPENLGSAVQTLPGPDLTVIQFLDARDVDGKTRKYRVMMIDGQLYPTHLAIGDGWKLHYYNAHMLDHPERLAEDRKFIENMNGFLGADVIAALKQIQKVLGLDYGGIDFGLNAKREILVFEANANMAVFPPDEDQRWNFRRPALELICSAVRTMLVSRASLHSFPHDAQGGTESRVNEVRTISPSGKTTPGQVSAQKRA
jgi:glutathione synthase/RimK-type ligase-like ATP-grasp enzyme